MQPRPKTIDCNVTSIYLHKTQLLKLLLQLHDKGHISHANGQSDNFQRMEWGGSHDMENKNRKLMMPKGWRMDSTVQPILGSGDTSLVKTFLTQECLRNQFSCDGGKITPFPLSAKLHYTDTSYGHVVHHHQRTPPTDELTSQQFQNLLYNKFTTNGQKFATSQHLDMSRCWVPGLRCGKFVVQQVVELL